MTQLSSSLLPTDDTGDLISGTALSRAFFTDWRDGINTLIHSATNPTVTPVNVIDEVVAARSGQASLDAYLDTLVALIGASGDAVDVPATFGENVSAGNAIYLSSGSGGGTAGRWYKTDSANDYESSTAAAVGFAPNAVLAAASDFARVSGLITGLAGLTAGTVYYASSTPGGVTSTPPANARVLGIAVSTTAILIAPREVSANATTAGLLSLAAQTFVGTKTLDAILSSAVFSALPTGIGASVYSRVSADFTKNNNVTLSDVTGLSFAVEANATYAFKIVVHMITPVGANFKANLTGPAAITSLRCGTVYRAASGDVSDVAAFGTNFVFTMDPAIDRCLVFEGYLVNGANAGTVQFQAAQNTLVVGDTKVYINSYVESRRIA